MFKLLLKLSKKYNDMQLVKSRKSHEILVACMFVFSISCCLFDIGNYRQYINIIAYIRVIDILVHNLCVAFFDKYKEENGKWKVIENISSYERMFMLNVTVIIELMMWSKYVIISVVYIAMFPTLYLVIKSLDKLIEKDVLR